MESADGVTATLFPGEVRLERDQISLLLGLLGRQ